MTLSIAHLGPAGTYTEMAALVFAEILEKRTQQAVNCLPCATIEKSLRCAADGTADWAIVPVENSIGGSVPITLDTLWQLENLTIHHTLVLPIAHGLLSHSTDLSQIRSVASHPQALSQCREWLEANLHQAERITMNSTTEALSQLAADPKMAAIASSHAAALHNVPIQAHPINDNLENHTRFWIVNREPLTPGSHASIGFSLYANVPGALVKALQAFAERRINLSRIESRPTQRSLGDYLFFIDIEDNAKSANVRAALGSIADIAENIRVLGSYEPMAIDSREIERISASRRPSA